MYGEKDQFREDFVPPEAPVGCTWKDSTLIAYSSDGRVRFEVPFWPQSPGGNLAFIKADSYLLEGLPPAALQRIEELRPLALRLKEDNDTKGAQKKAQEEQWERKSLAKRFGVALPQ